MQRDLDLARLPLELLVGAAVPDRHRAGAVVALRDLAVEVEVLERVVLGADREAVVLRLLGQAVRDRPRRERAVVLEAQVPVQARGVVLLDDEPRALRRLRGVAGGLRRRLEVALARGTCSRRSATASTLPNRELRAHATAHMHFQVGKPKCHGAHPDHTTSAHPRVPMPRRPRERAGPPCAPGRAAAPPSGFSVRLCLAIAATFALLGTAGLRDGRRPAPAPPDRHVRRRAPRRRAELRRRASSARPTPSPPTAGSACCSPRSRGAPA